jgi:hypothetical protein
MLTACAQAEEDIKCRFGKWQKILFHTKAPTSYIPVNDISPKDIVAISSTLVKLEA